MPYPYNFVNGKFEYPKIHRKANAVEYHEEIKKQFWDTGFYVVVKRFSAKEEKRRVVAYLIDPMDIPSNLVAFENCWNVFHIGKKGLDPLVAKGLVCFLNSTILDTYFRIFSGHTQVNATDLRNMKFPTTHILKKLGQLYSVEMNQNQIDKIIEIINE